ncbi:MAG: cation:proton antiporter [Planctomycetaceae bacterium]|nr:cation:proton antiporter [Planctomycetaceae bacterium]
MDASFSAIAGLVCVPGTWSLIASVQQTELQVLQLLLQLIVILLAARTGGLLFERLGQPRVVGEILAGLLLGPSVLGRLYPEMLNTLFPAESEPVLRILGQLGLILLMLDVGLQFDFGHLQQSGKAAMSVALAGIILPFGLGCALAAAMHSTVAPQQNQWGFMLIVATALSITAIPILGRIMMDLGLQQTPVGVLTITAAAIDDALGWILLAAVSGLVSGGFHVGKSLWQLGLLALFVLLCWFVVRPLSRWLLKLSKSDAGDFNTISLLLLLAFGSAVVTNAIGVFSVFGPFVVGACLSDFPEVRQVARQRMQGFVAALLLPVFFTFTGLKVNVGVIDTPVLWMWCILITLVASVGKMAGCGLAARWGGSSWREASMVAIMMNTRALMGLVAINIGRELGVLPDSVFSMLVIMAVATTVVTVPVLRRLLKSNPTKQVAS